MSESEKRHEPFQVAEACIAATVVLACLLWSYGPIGPPGSGGDREDAQRRGRLDPRNPPPGYYESHDRLPLRRRVREALAAARRKVTGLWKPR
jgi:hypothetical protein